MLNSDLESSPITANAGTWYTVNVLGRIILPGQPRWLLVYVEFGQAPGEVVWVDNLILTSECIPEPASLMVVIVGLALAVGFGKLRRK